MNIWSGLYPSELMLFHHIFKLSIETTISLGLLGTVILTAPNGKHGGWESTQTSITLVAELILSTSSPMYMLPFICWLAVSRKISLWAGSVTTTTTSSGRITENIELSNSFEPSGVVIVVFIKVLLIKSVAGYKSVITHGNWLVIGIFQSINGIVLGSIGILIISGNKQMGPRPLSKRMAQTLTDTSNGCVVTFLPTWIVPWIFSVSPNRQTVCLLGPADWGSAGTGSGYVITTSSGDIKVNTSPSNAPTIVPEEIGSAGS